VRRTITLLHFFTCRLLGLDLRKYSEIESFVAHVRQRYHRVDVLINNAAQTIRYPPAFYRSLVETEQRLASQNPSGQNFVVKAIGEYPFTAPSPSSMAHPKPDSAPSVHVDASRLLALSSLLPGEALRDDTLFPPGQVDSHGQQLDLRTQNSWILSVDEISPLELVEVQMVNAIAPFILTSQLLPLFDASPLSARFIVNVSSAEGQFHGYKAQHHPHTNMAKAALNMLTRTVGPTLAKKAIYMNAVDTGWVSKLGPVPSQNENRRIPLTTEDGAARVLDPIFSALLDPLKQPPSGVFFKHFAPAPW
jgi:NAD(P)-dependent dehydrogenase (short-subunit alcohol dehydrogenase family)